MKKIILILLLFISTEIFSQNPRKDNRFGLNFILIGNSLSLGISFDAFVSPSFDIEIGAGTGTGGMISGRTGFAGFNYHLFGKSNRNFTPYIGAFIGVAGSPTNYDQYKVQPSKFVYFSLPLGIQYISDGGFNVGLEIEIINENKKILFSKNKIAAIFGFKIGQHF